MIFDSASDLPENQQDSEGETEIQLTFFSYADLDAQTRIFVQRLTSEIKNLMKLTAQDTINIGLKLIEVKKQLRHGKFGDWLQAEFKWSDFTARQFMNVAKTFKSENFSDLNFSPSALYLLAASSTPDVARQEAIERARIGETITHAKAKEIVRTHQLINQKDGNRMLELEYKQLRLIEDLPPTPQTSRNIVATEIAMGLKHLSPEQILWVLKSASTYLTDKQLQALAKGIEQALSRRQQNNLEF